jgi:hypothetical protein
MAHKPEVYSEVVGRFFAHRRRPDRPSGTGSWGSCIAPGGGVRSERIHDADARRSAPGIALIEGGGPAEVTDLAADDKPTVELAATVFLTWGMRPAVRPKKMAVVPEGGERHHRQISAPKGGGGADVLGVGPQGGAGPFAGRHDPEGGEGPVPCPTRRAGRLGGCILLGGGWMHPRVPEARREEEGRGKPLTQSSLP